ncbi:Peptidase_C50 domain-containing protein [Cephalotus follicularis]|uniref:separase n=1 Tax=Cephalotus follicularis TaxID=3775 RepID=A0A1Q3BH72_CEPFO|nr:Peptidase_C50 domain-containing protein [Cephalotus follicularis]
MSTTTTSESSLLSKLETATSPPIYPLFTSYLSPFTHKIPQKDQTLTIRSLAKRYLQFLNKSLSILPKRLSNPSDLSQDLVTELFDAYNLCLDCLDLVSSQLSCKPCTIHCQRARLVRCLEAAGRYEDAEREGFRVFEKLRGSGEFGDKEVGMLVVDVAVTIVKCAAMGHSNDAGSYRRLFRLVDEIEPCFRVLDVSTYEKLHRVFVTYLGKCALFLVGELMCFDGDLVCEFCHTALTQYAKSSMKDQIYKFARRLCSSLFLLPENSLPLIIDLLKHVLDSTAHEYKVQMDNNGIEFVELVSYCATKCRNAGTNLCNSVARYLIDITGDFHQDMRPLNLILRLYATGLQFTGCDLKYRSGDFTTPKEGKEDFLIKIFLNQWDGLNNLAVLLGLSENYFHITCKEDYVTTSVGCNNAASQKKQIIVEFEDTLISTQLYGIQDVLHQFCDVSLLFQSCTSERERDGFDDKKTILNVVVAAYILSVSTELKLKKSVHLTKLIIASEWIQPQGLKYLFSSLYNIGVLLYRNNKVKEASKALKLCCRASWTCVVLLCQSFTRNAKGLQDDHSEDSIVQFVTEAFTRSAFILDVLHQCGSLKVKEVVAESLKNWSVAESLFGTLPGPMPLVKQWVKIQCKIYKKVDVEDSAPTLYHLLSKSEEPSLSKKLSSTEKQSSWEKILKRKIGIILEQELLAYEEMEPLNPELSWRMQEKITEILLHITTGDCLQKSDILLRKGRALRARGIEGLKECIQCLSEAISIMRSLETPPCHQLAAAYWLRALCNQEAEPNSKQVLDDINSGLKSLSILDDCHVDDKSNMMFKNTLLVLYNVVDLLSIKGMKSHHDIYELVIKLFKWKKIPLEKCLAKLWECRRLSHALCVSPINEAFIMRLSEHCGEISTFIDFWIHCFEGSRPLVVGFEQNFSFLFTNTPHNAYNHEISFRPDITADDVKMAAAELLASVPVSARSLFLAGYLYYDLCERLISNGRLVEALLYAKEAHRVRTLLFQEKFIYSVEQQIEKYDEAGHTSEMPTYGLKNFHVCRSAAIEVWSFSSISWDLDGYYISPWNVLQSYLESTLQLGTVHELIGNGVEAETVLLWGKNISCSQSLPLFAVAFSSVLGKLFRKKQFWNLAEKELKSAKQIFVQNDAEFSCKKCRLMLEVTVDQQLGDLFRSRLDSTTGNITIDRLSHAQHLYQSALDRLYLKVWKNSISCPEEGANESMAYVKTADFGTGNACTQSATNLSDAMEPCSKRERSKAKLNARKGRRTNKAPKSLVNEKSLISEENHIMTRSKCRSSLNQSVNGSCELQPGLSKHSRSNNVSDFGCEVACICKKLKCWNCLPIEVMDSQMMINFVHLKWEFIRRRLSTRALTGLGKCLGDRGQIDEAHAITLRSISVLGSRNSFLLTYSTVQSTFFLDFLGKEFLGEVFTIERAAILYNLSWFSMKGYCSEDTRKLHVLPNAVSWLKQAFVLSREVPTLFQKVSRLLAVIYILSSSIEHSPLSTSCKAISENQWASYFHQASLGTHLNYHFFLNMGGKCKAEPLVDAEGLHLTGSTSSGPEIHRLAPESIQDIEQIVIDFFKYLPCTTVVCISLLGGGFADLLEEFLCHRSCVRAWMMLSRLNSQPIVILMPVNSILEAEISDDEICGSGDSYESTGMGKHWHCPWSTSVVDDVAPAFKMILEENYLSSSSFPLVDTKKNRTMWWMRRKKLDLRLGILLRKLEDSWLGPWRYLLLGEWTNCQRLDAVHKKLVHDLKYKCKMDVNEILLKLLLGGARIGIEGEACISNLPMKKGCYIGTVEYCDKETCRGSPNSSHEVENYSRLAFQLIQEAVKKLEEEGSVNRDPIILVLDFEVQMLPWENIPILRNQEVYRMPSVSSISDTLYRSHHYQEQVGTIVAACPLIDPVDAFYLLNPSGDLSSTQVEFENWFRDQNFEGKAGSVPTAEELAIALKSHDLFIYFGHGSGAQYISKHDIQNLEKCGATLLMGCSSGSLSLNGCYAPQGAPLSYLLAGSPIIVANLWEVTDKDIDRFGKAMLDAWLKERSNPVGCAQCNSFQALKIKGSKGNVKKKVSEKNLPETCDSSLDKYHCDHRPKVGSFMGQAREACMLPFLIGASPVCYGVPTGIRIKKDH